MAEALVCAHHRHPLASDRIEHRTHVVHPLLQRKEPVERDRVGKAHPCLSNEISRLNEASRRT